MPEADPGIFAQGTRFRRNFSLRPHRPFICVWLTGPMSLALHQQRLNRPHISFGPFRFLEALPWLVLAATMRVINYGGGPFALPAIIIASIAVLLAFVLVAQRSIELAEGQTSLGSLTVAEHVKLALGILKRVALLMVAAGMLVGLAGFTEFAPNLMLGLDGMAFDQPTTMGKFWSPTVAALVLLMIVSPDANNGIVDFLSAVKEFGRRFVWIGATIAVLGAIYIGLGFVQGAVRHAIWIYGQTAPHGHFVKNLIFFIFIFSFAMLRLWITLLVLTYGLKQSYRYG